MRGKYERMNKINANFDTFVTCREIDLILSHHWGALKPSKTLNTPPKSQPSTGLP